MAVNGRVMKRPKRRVTADPQDFHRFPDSSDFFDGPFRTNIRAFIATYARLPSAMAPLPQQPPPQESPNLVAYQVLFRVGDASVGDEEAVSPKAVVDGAAAALPFVHLDIVEEDVARAQSVYCDQCRVGGWSDHPVCARRYHFIIRNQAARSIRRMCARCSSVVDPSQTRCSSCNYDMSGVDLEDSTHLLHGVIHGNGYGHLLRVNGREGGSKFLNGRDIMGFWDRLCKMLRVRKISVMDISKRHGLEYRLLHAVTTGRTWYGQWGYEFGAGSFGLTAEPYQKAVDILSNLPIFKFFSRSWQPGNQLQDTIGLYWFLSDRKLATVRDLFSFIVVLIHQADEQTRLALSTKKAQDSPAVLCAWSLADVNQVHDLMVKVLKAAGVGAWVTWRSLRGAVCHSVSSLELLDYCLKGLVGRTTGDGMMVASRCNADTNTIEYRLEAVSDRPRDPVCGRPPIPHLQKPSEAHLIRDLKFLYQSLPNPETMALTCAPLSTRKLVLTSARKLLDCKQFVKDYEKLVESPRNPFALYIWCEVDLVDQPKDYTAPPPELLVLPLKATVADLKIAATKAFQDAYLALQRFQAELLLDYGRVSDRTPVKLLLGSSATVKVRGRCIGDYHELEPFLKERGMENWIVECFCGARDDDGERMVACDGCGVWQHTRCVGINDFEDVPRKFVCCSCGGPALDIVLQRKSCIQPTMATAPSRKSSEKRPRDTASGGGKCKDDLMLANTSMTELERFGRMASVGG